MGIGLDRHRANQRIDAAAGDARLRYVTDVPGQSAVYAEKLKQAVAYIAARQLDAKALIPRYIRREAEARGCSAVAVAVGVIQAAAAYDEIGPEIEAARLAGKDAVMATISPEGVTIAAIAAISALNAL